MIVGKNLSDDERKSFYYTLDIFSSKLQHLTKEGIPHELN